MKIAIVSQHFPPENSGNASRVSDMAEKLAASGVDVTVVAPHPTFPTGAFPRTWRIRKTTSRGTVRVVNLWSWQPKAKDPGFLSRIAYYLTFPLHATFWALCNPGKYDVIVGSMPPVFTGIPGLVATTLYRRKRFVVEVRDLWIDAAVSLGFVKEKSILTRLSRRLEGLCYRRAALLAVTTEDVAEKVKSRYGLRGKPVQVVPNGVDTARFAPRELSKKQQFVYAGNIGHAQDLEVVIKALRIVRETHPHATIVIAGDGDIRAELEALAQAEGLSTAVRFPGVIPREAVPQLFSESIAGLAPLKKLKTLEYAVPTKAYEYMSCGIPFLGTGMGEIAKLASASGGGLIADNTQEDIARVMSWYLENPDKAAAMGDQGREYVRERYDRSRITQRYLAAIEGVQQHAP